MSVYVLYTIMLLGFLTNYSILIRQVKILRNKEERLIKVWEIALTTIVYGGPAILLMFMFKEFRDLDKQNKHFYLIYGIIITIVQIVVTTLLLVFKIVS